MTFLIHVKTFDLHAPLKHNYTRDNYMSFMNKALSKEITAELDFETMFLYDKNEENKRKYLKWRNYCVSHQQKSRSEYFGKS